MMKSVLALLLLVCPVFLFSQICPTGLSGTYKVGPTGTYHSIQEALDSLKSKGLSQAVILELQSSYNSSIESFPIKFSKVSCTDSTKTITLRPEAGASSLVISGGNDSVLLDFNNAYWFIIDGRAGGTGTTKQLRLNNTNTNGSTIRLINDACFNSFKHLDIQGASTSYLTGTIKLAGTQLSRGNDSNRVDTCNIYDGLSTPAVAIYAQGTFDKANTGLLINGCNIYNFFSQSQTYSNAIRMGSSTDSVAIVNNQFYQTSPRNFAGLSHVFFAIINIEAPFNGAFLIANNHIGGLSANNKMDLKGNFAFAGIKVANGDGQKYESLIQNNVIENIRIETDKPAYHRMIELGGAFGNFVSWHYTFNGNCTGNTIGSMSEDSSIVYKFTLDDETIARFAGINVQYPSPKDSLRINFNSIGGIHAYASYTNAYVTLHGMYLEVIEPPSPIGVPSQNVWIEDNIIGNPARKNSIVNTTGGEFQGIFIGRSPARNTTIVAARNKITNLTTTSTKTRGAGSLTGIFSTGGLRGSQSLVANQITYLSSKAGYGNGLITGIRDNHDGAQNAVNSIIGNTIYGFTSGEWPSLHDGAAVGIVVDGSTNNASTSNLKILIARNSIHSLSVVHGSGSFVGGIFAEERTIGATIENNMIRLGTDSLGNLIDTVDCEYLGISDVGSANDYIHNTVFIAGNRPSLGANSYSSCLNISYSPSFRTIRNNIFVNLRNAGTGNNFRHAAINIFGSGAPVSLSMNNNLYYLASAGTSFGSITISQGFATAYSLAEWRQISGKDSNSIVADPKFVNPFGNAQTGNLHVTLPSPIESAGSFSGTTILDFDGDIRANSSPVDIGADAGQFGTLEPTTNASNLQITNITHNSAMISCTPGSGTKRLIVIRRDSAVRDYPADGRSYNANPAFNQGANLGNATYVLSDSAATVTVTDLAPSTKYYVAVFEYNGAGQLTNYLTTGFLNGNFTTEAPTAVIDLQDPGFSVNISPNPTASNIWLNVKSDRFTNLKISVYAQSGALLFNTSKKINAGRTQIPIHEFSRLKPGSYFIQLQTDKSKGSTVIIKR